MYTFLARARSTFAGFGPNIYIKRLAKSGNRVDGFFNAVEARFADWPCYRVTVCHVGYL